MGCLLAEQRRTGLPKDYIGCPVLQPLTLALVQESYLSFLTSELKIQCSGIAAK